MRSIWGPMPFPWSELGNNSLHYRYLQRKVNLSPALVYSKNMKLDETFTAALQKSPHAGGWTYAVWPGSGQFFGTNGAVKVRGTVDGEPFQSSFMAMGDGMQMLPIKAAIRKVIGKEVGDTVTIHLLERL